VAVPDGYKRDPATGVVSVITLIAIWRDTKPITSVPSGGSSGVLGELDGTREKAPARVEQICTTPVGLDRVALRIAGNVDVPQKQMVGGTEIEPVISAV